MKHLNSSLFVVFGLGIFSFLGIQVLAQEGQLPPGNASSESKVINVQVPRLVLDYGVRDSRTGWRRIVVEPEGFSFLAPVAVDIKREQTRSKDYVYEQTLVFSFTSSAFFSIGRTITVNQEWSQELETALRDEMIVDDLFIGIEREFRAVLADKNVYTRGIGKGTYEGYPSREYIVFRDGKIGRGRAIINPKGLFVIYAFPSDESLSVFWVDRFMSSISFQPNL